MMRRLIPLIVLVSLVGCRKPASSAPDASVEQAAETPKIVVSKARTDLVFTYVDDKGGFHDVMKVDEVPEASRSQVLVRDLSKSPDELKAAEYLYIADLRASDSDGHYVTSVVSRRAFDRLGALDAAVQAGQGGQPAADAAPITLYTTSWCGVCKKTKAFLRSRGLPFVEKDVEKDPVAAREVQTKAAAKGLTVHGVPVIDVSGDLLVGFDEAALTRLLQQKGLSKGL
jgi:glutaredoxin